MSSHSKKSSSRSSKSSRSHSSRHHASPSTSDSSSAASSPNPAVAISMPHSATYNPHLQSNSNKAKISKSRIVIVLLVFLGFYLYMTRHYVQISSEASNHSNPSMQLQNMKEQHVQSRNTPPSIVDVYSNSNQKKKTEGEPTSTDKKIELVAEQPRENLPTPPTEVRVATPTNPTPPTTPTPSPPVSTELPFKMSIAGLAQRGDAAEMSEEDARRMNFAANIKQHRADLINSNPNIIPVDNTPAPVQIVPPTPPTPTPAAVAPAATSFARDASQRPKSLSSAQLLARQHGIMSNSNAQPRPEKRGKDVGPPPPPPPIAPMPARSMSPQQLQQIQQQQQQQAQQQQQIQNNAVPNAANALKTNNIPFFVPGVSPLKPLSSTVVAGGLNANLAKAVPVGGPTSQLEAEKAFALRNAQAAAAQAAARVSTSNSASLSDLMVADPLSLLAPKGTPPFAPEGADLPMIHPKKEMLTPKDHSFSRVQCIGDRGRFGTQDDTSCRFRNLCFDFPSNTWRYFVDPSQQDLPLTTLDGGIITEFPKPLLNLRSMGLVQDAQYWFPPTNIGAIPDDGSTYWIERSIATDVPDVFVLYHGHYPSNIGHIIGDDLFPIYNLMKSFNMESNQVQLIMSRDCAQIFGQGKKAQTCEKMLKIFPKGITQKEVLFMTQLMPLRAKLKVPETAARMCFENVLAGLSPFGFQQSLGKAEMWHRYHDFYLGNMGLVPSYTPRKQRIVVSIKEGKRGFYNTRELIEHLRKVFGDRFEITVVELRTLQSWKNELAFLLDTTVLITPCGGVSMSAMFLPKGSAMVVVDYWSTRAQNSVGMEDKLWANTGFIHAFHYPFTEREVILPEKGEWGQKFSRQTFADMRGYGMVNIDLDRMTHIVKAAISHVENFMVMGQ